jgi:hypothetical protein
MWSTQGTEGCRWPRQDGRFDYFLRECSVKNPTRLELWNECHDRYVNRKLIRELVFQSCQCYLSNLKLWLID